MHPKRVLLLVALMLNILAWGLSAPQPVYAASVRYAVPDGLTDGDCLSWTTACTLQHALATAVSGDQIWVRMGTYTPGAAGDARTVTFTLKNGVTLYGGFPPGTTSGMIDRSWISYPTILSGDLNGNGIIDSNDAYRVVTASNTDSSAVLDGFTITGGNANGDATQYSGAGIYIETGSPTLRYLVISGNETDGIGAGLYLYHSSPILNGVTFSNNLARMYGGAMYVYIGSPSLTNVVFDTNTVDGGSGGAIYLDSANSTLDNVTFRGNIAIPVGAGTGTLAGGSGGAMYVAGSNPILNNVMFSRNEAGGMGGGMDLENSSPILSNVTFNANTADFGGGAIFMNNSSPQIRNSIIWGDGSPVSTIFGSAPVYTRVILQGGGVTGTLNADPLFAFPAADNLHLRPGSPAINYGDNTVTAPSLPATDRVGYPRIADGTVDLGAYENQGPYNSAPVLSGTLSDLTMLEDPASNPGYKVSDILAGHVADVDGTAAGAGVAVYAADNTYGDWQFSTDGGTSWTDLGLASEISAPLLGPDAFLRFVPGADWNGTTSLSLRAWDIPPDLRSSGTTGANTTVNGGRTSFSTEVAILTLVVAPVNDVPHFIGGSDQVALKDGGAQSVAAWATLIWAGPDDESAQTLDFIVDNDNHALFSAQPAISVDGTLTYTPAPGATGSATVSVSLYDDGGTVDGGVDTSGVQTFKIFVTPPQVFVKAGANEANNGTSWADAYPNLQTALTRTTAGCEIWVAAATYLPGAAGNGDATFTLKNGVAIYGGFAGTEDNRDARNWKTHPTFLSGDLNGSATHDSSDAYHVVTANGVGSTTVLDGFTITGGNALNSETMAQLPGGGMILTGSNPTLSNLIFSGNLAGTGSGMYLDNSGPTLNYVSFNGNQAEVMGGGMASENNSSPILNNVAFNGNQANAYGGGMALTNSSNSILNNVIFSGNQAPVYGGGMIVVSSNPILSNVTFSGNHTDALGGGILLINSNLQVRNSILWGNTAGIGAQVYNLSGSMPVYTQVLIQGGGGTLDVDPQFVDADGLDGVYGTPDDNLRLNFGSPAIDVGNNFACPFIDMDGLPRPGDGNADGTPTCDLGAYEAGEMLCAAPYTFANQSGVSIQVDTSGNLACLYVDEMEVNHAQATNEIQTGRYWLIRGLQSDKTSAASGFSLTMTLPTSLTPDGNDKVCRYTGSAQNWHCRTNSFDAGAKTITRAGVTSLSDWAVGDDAPTAVRLVSLGGRAETNGLASLWPVLLAAIFGLAWAVRTK
jgi:hypothetical protein